MEWKNRYVPVPWLLIDADLAWSRARFADADPAGRRIPNAVDQVASAAITVRDLGAWCCLAPWHHEAGKHGTTGQQRECRRGGNRPAQFEDPGLPRRDAFRDVGPQVVVGFHVTQAANGFGEAGIGSVVFSSHQAFS